MATLLKQAEVMNTIIELKRQGIAQSDIAKVLRNMNLKPPSAPTIRKYYTRDDAPSASRLASPYQKDKAFDDPVCREIIISTLQANCNNKQLRISSLYDLLEEMLVDTGKLQSLPGNQQTLRNYCAHLRKTGQVTSPPVEARLCNYIESPPPGVQIQLDYGVQEINGGEHVHFLCIRMRYSRLLFVRAQDHRFNAVETCRTLFLFFVYIKGRPKELVIDQDSCMVVQETLGEIIATRDFQAFLHEQDIELRVLHKADPQSKGSVENLVSYVKKNYLSSRLDQPAQKLIAGIADWCRRKNTRDLNRATHRLPMQQFLEEELPALRPNLPSAYGCSAMLTGPVSIDKNRVITYKTNGYSVPPAYRFKNVYYRIVGGVMSVFSDEQGTLLIRQHQVAPPEVKYKTFIHPDDRRMPSTKWVDVKNTLLRRYPSPNMLHFLNGVCKENPHYREPQLSAVLAWLDKQQPESAFLESVLVRCCETFSYKVSQFQAIYIGLQKECAVQDDLFAEDGLNPSFVTMPNGVTVQVRGSETYQNLFQKKVQQTAMGGV